MMRCELVIVAITTALSTSSTSMLPDADAPASVPGLYGKNIFVRQHWSNECGA